MWATMIRSESKEQNYQKREVDNKKGCDLREDQLRWRQERMWVDAISAPGLDL
jgi:hypothetical protein